MDDTDPGVDDETDWSGDGDGDGNKGEKEISDETDFEVIDLFLFASDSDA